jgi:hypothetical protein
MEHLLTLAFLSGELRLRSEFLSRRPRHSCRSLAQDSLFVPDPRYAYRLTLRVHPVRRDGQHLSVLGYYAPRRVERLACFLLDCCARVRVHTCDGYGVSPIWLPARIRYILAVEIGRVTVRDRTAIRSNPLVGDLEAVTLCDLGSRLALGWLRACEIRLRYI